MYVCFISWHDSADCTRMTQLLHSNIRGSPWTLLVFVFLFVFLQCLLDFSWGEGSNRVCPLHTLEHTDLRQGHVESQSSPPIRLGQGKQSWEGHVWPGEAGECQANLAQATCVVCSLHFFLILSLLWWCEKCTTLHAQTQSNVEQIWAHPYL